MNVDPFQTDETGIPLERNFKLMRAISNPLVNAYSQISAFAACFLLLDSRVGCFFGAIHCL